MRVEMDDPYLLIYDKNIKNNPARMGPCRILQRHIGGAFGNKNPAATGTDRPFAAIAKRVSDAIPDTSGRVWRIAALLSVLKNPGSIARRSVFAMFYPVNVSVLLY